MIDEILYMETRVFSDFCKRKNISAREANRLFNLCDIWNYIETCYDSLHLSGDDSVLDDVEMKINKRGAAGLFP